MTVGLGTRLRAQVQARLKTRLGSFHWLKEPLLAGFLFGLFASQSSYAVHFVFSDIDDTFLETRRALGGSFSTAFRLFRITYRDNVLQPIPSGPEYVDVSPRDLLRLVDRNGRSLLASGEGRPGPITQEAFKLEDGREFEAWNYMIIRPQTFASFYPAPPEVPEGFFARDIQAALSQSKQAESIRGEAYPLIQLMLAEPDSARELGHITARAHNPEEILNGYRILQRQSNPRISVRNLPSTHNFHSISHEDFTVLTKSYEVSERKAEDLNRLILNLKRVRLSDKDLTLNPDGTERGRYHTLVFIEDNQKTVDKVAQLFRAKAMGRSIAVKLILWNVGFDDEVSARSRPKISVFKNDGTFRAATLEDLVGPIDRLTEAQKQYIPEIESLIQKANALQCGEYLTNDGSGRSS